LKRTWTIVGVGDVPRSFRWYQSLFGEAPTQPGHSFFGQLRDADGTVLLCLHEWGVEDHPSLRSPGRGTPGNGLLLFFRVDDYEASLRRARALAPRLEEEPHLNPNTKTLEFSLRDPDGYYVTISALTAGAEKSAVKRRLASRSPKKKPLVRRPSARGTRRPRG
jgi:catechol 2,3-dioxygenase-like lactoylglutathione lyase family enzyme